MNKKIINVNYQEKIIQIKRVTKVIKGGKKMTFRVILIIGNKINKVGIGIGKAEDISLAIEKAIYNGKNNLITISVNSVFSIEFMIKQSYKASKILLRPAILGTGLKASGAIRTVLELGGIKNIIAKQFGSNNLLNNARATILALNLLKK